jgi:hypothetical protein
VPTRWLSGRCMTCGPQVVPRTRALASPYPAKPGGWTAAFGQERAGQLRVVPDIGRTSPPPPRWRLARTVWHGSFYTGFLFIFGACYLSGFFGGHGLGSWWWTRLVFGSLAVLGGIAYLWSTLRLHRYQRRLADSATGDANPRL